MYTTLKTIQEDYINDLLYYERQQFLNDTKGKYPDNKADGYNHRSLTISLDTTLNIKVPKCRYGNRELIYSLFKKYCRHTGENLEKIRNLYREKNFKSFVCSILKTSKLPDSIKNKLKEKYLTLHKKFVSSVKKAPEIIKLDATHFGSRRSPCRHVMYFVFGIDSFGKKTCLYFYVAPGSENRAGWENVVKHIKTNIDLTDTQVIVSDMHSSLKILLKKYFPLKPLQNCMFHRLQSIIAKIETHVDKNYLLSVYYKEIRSSSSREQLEDIFDTFKSFDYMKKRDRRSPGRSQKNIDRMLNHCYEDNFTFLDLNLKRKLVIQNMDMETIISDLKNYLRYNRRKTKEILIWKTMMFLDKKNYLDNNYI